MRALEAEIKGTKYKQLMIFKPMKRFFVLAALVLGLAACQTEPEGLDIKLDGEVDATITVSIPDSETRTGGNNSALGVFDNGILDGDATMRYILQVYYGETASQERLVKYNDGKEVNFDVRLVPGRAYKFVAWADVVEGNDFQENVWNNEDGLHYNTADLKNITLKETWVAMDETRDAFTDVKEVTNFNAASVINLTLTRPFAKLRVKTTDVQEMDNIRVTPAYATVEYTTPYRAAFNAFEGHAVAAGSEKKKHSVFEIANYGDNNTNNKILFTDYFFAEDGDAVSFILDVYEDEAKTKLIKSNNFNTDIAVNRNYLTTIQGNILTDGNNITVTVENQGRFENVDDNGNTTNPNYEYKTISSDKEFLAALESTGKYIVISDLTIANAGDTVNNGQLNSFSTRANAGASQTTVINLNGYTITLKTNITIAEGKTITITDINENGETGAIVSEDGGAIVNNGTLKIEGGNIEKSTNNAPAIVNNGTLNIEGGNLDEGVINNTENGNVTITNDNIDNNVVTGEGTVTNYAKGLEDAFTNGGEYTLGADVTLNKSLTLAADKTLVLNLNGKTITGTDTITGSFGLITNKGNLTITGEGKMTLVAQNNRGWNAYSSVISNTVGGKLVVENGTIEHLGGTDMAYGIDNLTNGKGTYAETVINGGTIKSPYRAIRQFLNGTEAQNILTVNGGVIEGANKSIWMQDPSAKANTGTLVVNEGATLNGDVYLYVCAGSTEWPVSVSIAASAVNGEVLTGNVPENYAVELVNGNYVVNHYTVVSTTADLQTALAEGKQVRLANDLNISEGITAPYGNKTALSQNGGLFDGNGKTITANLPGDNYIYMTNGGTTKNLNVTGAFRGIMIMSAKQTVYLDNVVSGGKGVVYGLNTGEGNSTQDLVATNCTFNGWCSWSLLKSATFTNCTFGQGSEYTNVMGRIGRPYVNTVFDGCDFCSKYYIDLSIFVGTKVIVKNCTVNGVKITAENWTSLVAPEATCGEGQISVELKNGTFLTAENVADYIVFE